MRWRHRFADGGGAALNRPCPRSEQRKGCMERSCNRSSDSCRANVKIRAGAQSREGHSDQRSQIGSGRRAGCARPGWLLPEIAGCVWNTGFAVKVIRIPGTAAR
eukprot:8213790-Karenia_brevis.AAC.1